MHFFGDAIMHCLYVPAISVASSQKPGLNLLCWAKRIAHHSNDQASCRSSCLSDGLRLLALLGCNGTTSLETPPSAGHTGCVLQRGDTYAVSSARPDGLNNLQQAPSNFTEVGQHVPNPSFETSSKASRSKRPDMAFYHAFHGSQATSP